MNEELKAKINKLTDFSSVSIAFDMAWAKNLEWIRSHKEEAEHGESPNWQKLFDMAKDERYIDNLPMFERAVHLAIIDFAIENNQNLLEVVQDLIAQQNP